MSGEIFVSYRRDDSAGTTGRLYDRLIRTFPREKVFMDVDAAMHGLDFVRVLNDKIAACDAVVVIIGPDWLSATDKAGNRRIDNPQDFVRIEVSAALKREIPVIPVLVDGATLPSEDDLPDDLKPMVRRHAVQVRNTRFGDDANMLVSVLAQRFGVVNRKTWRWPAAVAALAVAVAALVAVVFLRSPLLPVSPGPEPASNTVPTLADVPRPAAQHNAIEAGGDTDVDRRMQAAADEARSLKEANDRPTAIEADEERRIARERITRLEAEAAEAARRRAQLEAEELSSREAAAEARARAEAAEAAERQRKQAEAEAEDLRRRQSEEAERQRQQAAAQAFIPATSWAHSYPSRAAAEQAALSTCPGSCKIAIWVQNACAAIAVGERGAWGTAWHSNRRHAEQASVVHCRQYGDQGCAVRQWICSNGYGAISVQTTP
ncbi:MAG: DUF4189 domain-containing protein [Hyphomicrobium sp.]|jgi:hypothetical protein